MPVQKQITCTWNCHLLGYGALWSMYVQKFRGNISTLPEDKGDMLLRKVGSYTDYTSLYPRTTAARTSNPTLYRYLLFPTPTTSYIIFITCECSKYAIKIFTALNDIPYFHRDAGIHVSWQSDTTKSVSRTLHNINKADFELISKVTLTYLVWTTI
jgi:hypothetical protein